MFSRTFRRYLSVTKVFLLVRFAASLVVSLVYLLVAAFIQNIFVSVFGENTFNYIVGGLLSLFLGCIACHYIGTLIFMFVKGWHVAALAYVPKIERNNVSALEVGIRAFNKNFISFATVYGVRQLINGILPDFKAKFWDIMGEAPFANFFRTMGSNPIVEHLAGDILHYGFDATIFYIVRHKINDINEIPSTVLEAVKRYLYCLPTILVASAQSYIIFRIIPSIFRVLFIFYILYMEGFVAGVLITVLLVPVFYILENAFFDPLTMLIFLSSYARKCDAEIDPEDPVVQAVDAVLEEQGVEDAEIDDAPVDKENHKAISEDSEAIPTILPEEEPPLPKRRHRHEPVEEAEVTPIISHEEEPPLPRRRRRSKPVSGDAEVLHPVSDELSASALSGLDGVLQSSRSRGSASTDIPIDIDLGDDGLRDFSASRRRRSSLEEDGSSRRRRRSAASIMGSELPQIELDINETEDVGSSTSSRRSLEQTRGSLDILNGFDAGALDDIYGDQQSDQ